MLTLRLNARSSISALLTVKEVFPSTVSSVQTEPSSIRTTSSVTGGSTLTAPKLKLLLQKRIPSLLLPELKHLRLLLMLVTMFPFMLMLAKMFHLILELILSVQMLAMEPLKLQMRLARKKDMEHQKPQTLSVLRLDTEHLRHLMLSVLKKDMVLLKHLIL